MRADGKVEALLARAISEQPNCIAPEQAVGIGTGRRDGQ
jgi:hypothetical protein